MEIIERFYSPEALTGAGLLAIFAGGVSLRGEAKMTMEELLKDIQRLIEQYEKSNKKGPKRKR